MEVKETSNIIWLDKSHPNYERWKRAREISFDRAKVIENILNEFTDLRNLNILDLGSGEGGTSELFSQNNFVISYDLNYQRLLRQNFDSNYQKIQADAKLIPFKNNSFDLIILQDVIEHISDHIKLIKELKRILKDNGIIYLSTPNKYSIINLTADPHWGLPFLSILKRKNIKKYFLKFFRRKDFYRNDIAELLSLKKIYNYFNYDYLINLQTKKVFKMMMEGDRGIVWSDFHLRLLKILKRLPFHLKMINIVNDKKGILNNLLTPEFYIVLKRKNI